MSDDLADVLGTEENPCLEFKQSANDNSVILRAICAMSNDLPNRGGGDLLIGVDKHGNALDGVDVSDRALLALTDMRDNGKIIDRPSLVVDRGKFQGFSDRIEITNPGGPYGQVRDDNFDRVNDYRNPSLAGAMKSLGFVNRFGRGIGRILKSLESNGNPPAEFIIDASSWVVVIRRAR